MAVRTAALGNATMDVSRTESSSPDRNGREHSVPACCFIDV
uniref:Uncharacterized protein n=1 Tax=Anguilla anguilla TaxID=7936 RepID=A0A0E9RMB3_ANGAN